MSKVGTCCPETDSVCLTEKIGINHQIIFLIWIFLTVCSIQLTFRHLFRVFWFELQKCLEKIIFSLLFCFSQLLSLLFFTQFCKPKACFFFAQTFLAGKRKSSLSCLFAVEENYFNRALTSLISLQWVMYEGSFQVCDGRWWKKILECQTLKLGDAHVHPQ